MTDEQFSSALGQNFSKMFNIIVGMYPPPFTTPPRHTPPDMFADSTIEDPAKKGEHLHVWQNSWYACSNISNGGDNY